MKNDIELIAKLPYKWNQLNNKTVLMSGGTGFIGTLFCEVINYRNKHFNQNTTIFSLSRHPKKSTQKIKYIRADIKDEIRLSKHFDFVIHLASNTHPEQYKNDPIGTILTNVYGCNNLLEVATKSNAKFILASSVEIYGNCINKPVNEDYCGFINCNNARSGYNESKRLCESLLQSYRSKHGIKTNSIRFARVFGPDTKKDTKAINQFINYAINNQNIVINSKGDQLYSYVYIADAVSSIFKIMIDGEDGEAYNVSSNYDKSSLKNIASFIAKLGKTKLITRVKPNAFASASKYAIISNSKIKKIGWRPLFSLKEGLNRTYHILATQKNK